MDRVGIQGFINRINEIEAEIDSKFQVTNASFQTLLQSSVQNQAPPPSPLKNPATLSLPFSHLSIPYNHVVSPNQIIAYKGHPMTLKTAGAFRRLEELIERAFPGRAVTITSTTDGQHDDPNHATGKAIDFVVEGLTKAESRIVEDLSRQAGFVPYNEYLLGSRLKTGSHMHVDLAT